MKIGRGRRAAYTAVVAIAFLGAVEACAHLYYGSRHPRYMVRPTQDPVLGYVTVGAHGLPLRGPAPDLTRPRRVLLLGDSVTYGEDGAERDTFAARLRAGAGDDVAILNAGMPGYNTWQERRFLAVAEELFAPTAVVLQFCINDDYPGVRADEYRWATRVQRDEGAAEPRFLGSSRAAAWLWAHSAIVRASYVRKAGALYEELERDYRDKQRPGADEHPWRGEWRDEFAALVGALAGDGDVPRPARVLLVPTLHQLRDPQVAESAPEARRIAERVGVEVVDVLDAFRASPGPREALYAGDPMHLARPGHAIVARELLERAPDLFR